MWSRWDFANIGVNMITSCIASIHRVFVQLLRLLPYDNHSTYSCPYCRQSLASFEQLYEHVPLYHTNEPALAIKCVLCQKATKNYAVHLHEEHTPHTVEQIKPSATPLYAFALVVCQRKHDHRFLVAQEAGTMGYWLPGGRVEVGERLDVAAQRETWEEAAVKIRLTGILKIKFTPKANSNRLCVIFFAEPFDENDCEAKSLPDYER
jgi:hypothetical protein